MEYHVVHAQNRTQGKLCSDYLLGNLITSTSIKIKIQPVVFQLCCGRVHRVEKDTHIVLYTKPTGIQYYIHNGMRILWSAPRKSKRTHGQ